MSLTARTRRLVNRPSRLVVGSSIFATLILVSLTYILQSQPHLLHPWSSDAAEGWDWERLAASWGEEVSPDGSALTSFAEDDTSSGTHHWDMVCHEGVHQGLRVALYDFTPFHEEVIGSVVASLNDTGVHVDVFRNSFRYGFGDILETFYPNDEGKAFHWQDQLPPKLKAGEYDALIMTSCDERWIQPELLELLPTITDIPIICLHHEMWSFEDHRSRLFNSAKAGKLTFVALGEHVRKLIKEENTDSWTRDGRDGDFAWNEVPTEVFVPIFPLPPSIPLPSRLAKTVIPNDVAILGNVNDDGRRDYRRLWADLIAAIQASPAEWGYTVSEKNGHFIPLTAYSDVQPFRVHLFGGLEEGVSVPPELEEHVLVFHSGLAYVDFYRELSKLDLVLPILSTEEYIRNRATAAFPAGIISRIPSLVTPSLLKSYNYLEPPAIILHPDGTNEVEILAAMRRGQDSWTTAQGGEDQPSVPAKNRYMRSGLLDSLLEDRPFLQHKEWDWEGYVHDVRAYNAKLLCEALLR